MPGAAYLAKITSHTAHASGVKFALAAVIASRPWAARGEVAFAGAFGVVGFGAVLIEQEQPQVGGLAQLFGSDAGRDAHQVDLELRGGDGVDPRRQAFDGVADRRRRARR